MEIPHVFMICCDLTRLQECDVYRRYGERLNIEVVETELCKNPIRGCYEAHYKVAQIAQDRGLKSYICLEDNVSCSSMKWPYFLKIMTRIKELDLPFCYLSRFPKPIYNSIFRRIDKNIYEGHPQVNGTSAYYMTDKIYTELLQNPYDDVHDAIDGFLANRLLEKEYFVSPSPFKRGFTKSKISKELFMTVFRRIYFNGSVYTKLEIAETHWPQLGAIIAVFIVVIILLYLWTNTGYY